MKASKEYMEKERYKSKVAVFLILLREINGEKEMLFQKRMNTGWMDNLYDSGCSGHLEKNESIKDALIRETLEEIGIIVKKEDIKLVLVDHAYQDEYFKFYFECSRYLGISKIMEKDKCSELKWINLKKLPENVIPYVKEALLKINNQNNYSEINIK